MGCVETFKLFDSLHMLIQRHPNNGFWPSGFLIETWQQVQKKTVDIGGSWLILDESNDLDPPKLPLILKSPLLVGPVARFRQVPSVLPLWLQLWPDHVQWRSRQMASVVGCPPTAPLVAALEVGWDYPWGAHRAVQSQWKLLLIPNSFKWNGHFHSDL